MKSVIAVSIGLLLTAHVSAQLSYDRIRQADREPGHWLTYHGTYDGKRYSTLDEIDRTNVQRLRPVWMYQVQGRHHFEATPLVFDGVMYLTDPPSDVVALDVKTGRPIWTYRRTLPDDVRACCGQVNRGVAALGDQIFIATIDAHLVALDMRTGRVRWDIEVADYKTGHSMTGAPLAVKDKIIIGIAGAEYGIRGFLDAYDASTGKRAWRLWTVPGPGEPGHETWSGDSWKYGGATTWVTGAYDPDTNLTYWGTGNPGPDFVGDVRNGDNLYLRFSDCRRRRHWSARVAFPVHSARRQRHRLDGNSRPDRRRVPRTAAQAPALCEPQRVLLHLRPRNGRVPCTPRHSRARPGRRGSTGRGARLQSGRRAEPARRARLPRR